MHICSFIISLQSEKCPLEISLLQIFVRKIRKKGVEGHLPALKIWYVSLSFRYHIRTRTHYVSDIFSQFAMVLRVTIFFVTLINLQFSSSLENQLFSDVTQPLSTHDHKVLQDCHNDDYRTYLRCLKRHKRHEISGKWWQTFFWPHIKISFFSNLLLDSLIKINNCL